MKKYSDPDILTELLLLGCGRRVNLIDVASENSDSSLRLELARITQQEKIDDHPELIRKLRSEQLHSIELATELAPTDVRMSMYNCFMYAFELVGPGIVRVASALPETISNGQFVSYLIAERLEEIHADEAREGDVVIYSDAQEIKHAGRVLGDFVISKWGHGHLWRHRLYEIPSNYGHNVRFFKQLNRSVAEQAFLEHVRIKHSQEIIDELLAS